MAVGTTTSVKHNLKAQQAQGHRSGNPLSQTATFRSEQEVKESSDSGRDNVQEVGRNDEKHAPGKHQSHDSCKSCGSLANKCSCKECECQVCRSKTRTGEHIEPAIKSATSSTVVCGGGCIRAAQRAASGGCPGCECPADGCSCTKCGLHPMASNPGEEAGNRATTGNCPACGCPAGGNCPCTGCKCPLCKSAYAASH